MAAYEGIEYSAALAAIVRAGLSATRMSGIQSILENIAKHFHCFGCVLFEASPGVPLSPESQEGTFFAMAQWFENGATWKELALPMNSATGYAVAQGLPFNIVTDTARDLHHHHSKFLEDHELRSACVVPLRFADAAAGSLNLYRLSNSPPFMSIDGVRISQVASVLPALYETIRDEVAYRCSRAVNDLLQRRSSHGTARPTQQMLGEVAQAFCSLLSENLRCFDVSVYLEEEDNPEVYVLSGSTLPNRSIAAISYKKGETSPTASALTYRRPIRILDLRQPNTFPLDIKITLPSPGYIEYGLDAMASDLESPLSFMAVPILAGEQLLGVLRCCMPLAGPTYFARREEELLMLLAGQIGRFVSDQRSRREVYRESQGYKVILESISSITDLVYTELRRRKPDENRVLNDGLQGIAFALPGEQWTGIGVRQDSASYLRRNVQISFKEDRPKSIVKLPLSWEAELKDGRGILKRHEQLQTREGEIYTESLPKIPSGVILAPIQCLNEFWILEIVKTGGVEFPKHAVAIAVLLGKQLGIYHDLLTTIVQLTRTQAELGDKIDREKRAARVQAQAMMDLEHQIRAPLRHANRRMPVLLRLAASSGIRELVKQCQYLRGNLRRAGRVAGNARLFSRLAAGQPIECNPESWSYEDIRLVLIEAAMDYLFISEQAKGVTFRVDDDSFSRIPSDGRVRLDKDLLDQVINDLLDNAGKYCDPNTQVKIDVSLSKAYFIVTVTNKGLKISSEEVQTIRRRGERGTIAALVTGEGSGIGLWIADEIMKAHGGNLDITPTGPDRVTRIRLMFPVARG